MRIFEFQKIGSLEPQAKWPRSSDLCTGAVFPKVLIESGLNVNRKWLICRRVRCFQTAPPSSGLAVDIVKSDPRELILSIFVGWQRIWAKVIPESSCRAFWWAGRGYGQKLPQKHQFQNFGGLAADISKGDFRKLRFNILVGWPQIWAKVVSEGSV